MLGGAEVSVYKMAVAHCVHLMQCVIQYLVQFQDGWHIPESTLEFFSLSVELTYRELLVLDLTDQLTNSQKEAIEIVRQCLVVGRELERPIRISCSEFIVVLLVDQGMIFQSNHWNY